MLKRRRSRVIGASPYHKAAQNLRILVAQVQVGALSSPREPNFALLSKAAHTIEEFLNSEDAWNGLSSTGSEQAQEQLPATWDFSANLDVFDFDIGFWDVFTEQSVGTGLNMDGSQTV